MLVAPGPIPLWNRLDVVALRAVVRASSTGLVFESDFEARPRDGFGDARAAADLLTRARAVRAEDALAGTGIDADVLRRALERARYEVDGPQRRVLASVSGDARAQAGARGHPARREAGRATRRLRRAPQEPRAARAEAHRRRGARGHDRAAAIPAVRAAGARVLDSIRGSKYQSARSEWSGSWSILRFKLDDPQRYAYSVETSPDGKRVVIRAEGDLNGDGKTSLFELEGRVQSGAVTFAPSIREVDPEEVTSATDHRRRARRVGNARCGTWRRRNRP